MKVRDLIELLEPHRHRDVLIWISADDDYSEQRIIAIRVEPEAPAEGGTGQLQIVTEEV